MLFRNPIALWALALLIPLIIFYFFSRKPQKLIFSSLMFFVKDNMMKKRTAFLRRLLANLLLFLQFLAIALLGFAAATPLLDIPQNQTEEHIAIILDSSASMQANYQSSTRFDKAISEARDIIKEKKKVSIILAENNPIILLDKGSAERADEILKQIQPSDTTSNIEDALFQAMTLMDGGGVYILSDFSSVSDPILAKRQLNSKGINVHVNEFSEPVKNVGIVDAKVADTVTLKIKNFNNEPMKFNVKSNTTSKEITLKENGVEEINFDITPGKNYFWLDVKDDFTPDNMVFVSVPEKNRIKTLYITNNVGKDFLKTALESLNKLDITTTILPVVPTEENYRLYIIKDINKDKLLPSTFHEIYQKAASTGAAVVIHVQANSPEIDYKDLKLLQLGTAGEYSKLIKNINNKATADVNFGDVKKYFQTTGENCDRWVVSSFNDTVICNKKIGTGNVLFYGILEDSSDFKNTPEYPLFWSYLIDQFIPEEENYELNYKTGVVIPIALQGIETPVGNVISNKVMFDRTGFYHFDNKTTSANLIDFKESNINTKAIVAAESGLSGGSAFGKVGKKDLTKELLWIAVLLVLIELIVIKWRGDL